MRNIVLFTAVFCSFSSAFALTPFDLDLSRVKTCKLKFDLKGGETLITSILALDEKGAVVAEFGDSQGKPFESSEELAAAKAALLKNGTCTEIKNY